MEVPDLFKTAPAEVTNYFANKQNLPTFDWRDIAPQEHAFSWTVAKSAGFDILDDVRNAVDDAIVNRVPFEEFQKQLVPVLQSKGWWGKRKVTDPNDGYTKLVQLGSPRRLKTIYWANTRTAHAAGEWERTQRNKAFLPFLLYTLSEAERRRPEHQAWVGTTLPIDHPFWETHYPPNGWGCKCGVRQITQREAKDNGWHEGQADPEIINEPWFNKRSGKTISVPKGIDPGWQTNPGQSRQDNRSEFLLGRVEAMASNRQRIAIEDIVGSPILKAMVEGHMPKTYLPVAQLPRNIIRAFNTKSNLVRLSDESAKHILLDNPSRKLETDDFRHAIKVLQTGTFLKSRTGALVALGIAGDKWWRVVVKSANKGNELWINSFHRKSQSSVEQILRREKNKGNIIE